MDTLSYVSKTDLARKTRQVIRSVQRGQTVIVESHGQPEAAILDMPDYYILRAVTRYHTERPKIDFEADYPDEGLTSLPEQERYDRAMGAYLAGAISLGRAAELMGLEWIDLRSRLQRLNAPLRIGPESVEEALQDADVAEKLSR